MSLGTGSTASALQFACPPTVAFAGTVKSLNMQPRASYAVGAGVGASVGIVTQMALLHVPDVHVDIVQALPAFKKAHCVPPAASVPWRHPAVEMVEPAGAERSLSGQEAAVLRTQMGGVQVPATHMALLHT
jgi:hypothetical protein